MKLTEYNLIEYIDNQYTQYKNWEKIYSEMKEIIIQQSEEDKYASLISNYLPIFLYAAIKNQISMNEYDSLLHKIFDEENKTMLGSMMYRLLGDNPDIGLKFYLKEGKYNHEKHFWASLAYVFFTIENNKRVFDKETLPYLVSLFKYFPEDRISALYEGRVFSLFYAFSNQLEELLPLLDTVQINPALSIRDPQYHKGVIGTLLYALSSISYEKTDEENKKSYQFCLNHITNIHEIIEKELVSPKLSNQNEWELKSNLLHFLLSVEMDVFSILNKKYVALYTEKMEHIKNKMTPLYAENNDIFEEVMRYFSSSLSVAIEKDFILNLELIDLNQDLHYNWIYLKGLEVKIEKSYPVEISQPLHDYLIYHLNLVEEESKKDHYPSKMKIGVESKKIMTFLYYYRLDKSLENKEISKPQYKI